MRTLNKEAQQRITPVQALALLKEGNKRFVHNLQMNRNLLEQVNETRTGQYPFAVILSCIDSRTSPELIFDQGLGDIFSIRIAGNVINDDILGSMEFACKIAGSRFIVVLGHTECGAVKGACDRVHLGHLSALLGKINPAIIAEKTIKDDRNSTNASFIEQVSKINVEKNVQFIIERSYILRELIETGNIGLIGAMYDIHSGEVAFYDHTLIYDPPYSVPPGQSSGGTESELSNA